jgi:hypothetical protein
VPGWHYYPNDTEKSFMTVDAANGCVNYGLSHGMAGPLAVLSLAHKNGIRKQELECVINGLVLEYKKASYYANDIAYWPGKITFEQYVGLEEIIKGQAQMSWCYGSVAILRVLYLSGVLTSNNEVEQFALDELIKIAEMNLVDFALKQPIVCHGFVGTAAIINLMYLETGRAEFHKKVLEMLEVSASISIEQFFENEKQRANERNTPLRASLHDHLEGYNGMVQTILAIIKGNPSGNDKRLLIV